jgi:5-methylcytosine-specific restriction endonuclease McrA
MTKIKCDYCKRKFDGRSRSDTKHSFCSMNCYKKWLSKRQKGENSHFWKGGKITLKCEHCGNEFDVRRYLKNRRFCSIGCRAKQGEWHPHSNRVSKKCKICGKTYRTTPFRASRGSFCSKECMYKWMSKNLSGKNSANWKDKVAKICDNCGNTYEVIPCLENRRFCSNECRWAWFSGENNPRWKGGHEPYYGPNWRVQRRRARDKDNYTCQICGEKENGQAHDAHHIIPFRRFGLDNYKEANRLGNLTTLCRPCHLKIENELMGLKT